MASETAYNPTTHSPQLVCNAFVNQYYHTLHHSPELVYQFYQDSSEVTRPDSNGVMTSVTTMKGINEMIVSLNFKEFITEIQTADAQKTYKEGVNVLVTGCLTSSKDKLGRKFAQSFILVPQNNVYFVMNDVFRYFQGSEPSETGKLNIKSGPNKTEIQQKKERVEASKFEDMNNQQQKQGKVEVSKSIGLLKSLRRMKLTNNPSQAKQEIVDKVCDIVKLKLALPEDSSVAKESKFSVLGANSLHMVEIMSALEKEYEITFEEDSAIKSITSTVSEAAEMVVVKIMDAPKFEYVVVNDQDQQQKKRKAGWEVNKNVDPMSYAATSDRQSMLDSLEQFKRIQNQPCHSPFSSDMQMAKWKSKRDSLNIKAKNENVDTNLDKMNAALAKKGGGGSGSQPGKFVIVRRV